MTARAVTRLHNDINRLHKAERARHQDARELNKDERALKTDRKQLKNERDEFSGEQKDLKKDRAALGDLRETKEQKLAPLKARKAELQQQYEASIDPATGQGDPEIKSQIDQVAFQESAVRTRFDPKIDAKRADVEQLKKGMDESRRVIKRERGEIKQDRREIKHDKKELKESKERVHDARQKALKDLRPAEYEMGLKATNRARKELGLKPVDKVIRPLDTNSVRGAAQFLLKSKNVSFWSGLSTGSDRKALERLARGEKAYVPATGQYVKPNLRMMQALVDMAKHGPIMINALTGGSHSPNSNHYRGMAVDLDVGVGDAGEIERIANRHGGTRNYETSHIHLDF